MLDKIENRVNTFGVHLPQIRWLSIINKLECLGKSRDGNHQEDVGGGRVKCGSVHKNRYYLCSMSTCGLTVG